MNLATQTVWDAASRDFKEVEVDKRRLTGVERCRRNNAMEDFIADGYATLRETAAVMGVHNSTVYRNLAHRMGRRRDEVLTVWTYNRSVSLERANAARRARKQTTHQRRDLHDGPQEARPGATEDQGER